MWSIIEEEQFFESALALVHLTIGTLYFESSDAGVSATIDGVKSRQEDLGSEIEEEPNEHLTKETSGLDKSDMGVSATKDGVDFEGLTGVSSSSSITRTVGFQLVDFSVLCFFLDGIVSGVDRSMVSF